MANVVGHKGQVVIEKFIRDHLNIKAGYITVQKLVDDHVEIYFYPPEHNQSLRGVLSNFVQKPVAPDQWTHARDQAWRDAVCNITNSPQAE
jgi:AbrB family looped-hinge helix DNA binding protein